MTSAVHHEPAPSRAAAVPSKATDATTQTAAASPMACPGGRMLNLGNGPGIVALPNRGLATVPRWRRIIAGCGTQRATLLPASPA